MNSYEVQTEYDASIERQQNQNKKETSHSAMKRLSNSGKLLVNINEDNIYAVFISCVEIYNNYIYDLLDDTSNYQTDLQRRFDSLTKESKCLKEDNRACMYIKDVTEIEVKSTEEALDLMSKAQKKRVVACTELNAESSRSHSIFTIRVVQVDNNLLSESATNRSRLNNSLVISQLCLVDLAGSERTKRTKNTGSRLKEAGSINSSLMALRNCLETLRENINNGTRKMVPYRDSKLTLLFKNYFEGNGKIKMILCLNPNAIEFDETINVLKFSDLVRDILLPAVVPNNPITQQQQQQQQQSSTKTSSSSSSTTPKQSLDTFTQANLGLLANLQQKFTFFFSFL
jgi:kinesin family protein 23